MPSEHARHWMLDPAVDFLNHGSFGATPLPVLEDQQRWRERMEKEPVRFFARDHEPALDAARHRLAAFVGADADDLAFVANATSACNAVLRSVRFDAGDELLTTDHAYNAVRNAMDYVAERDGARVVVVAIPFPGAGSAEVVERVLAAVTARTRLAVLDHVTSSTALVLPIAELVTQLAARGVNTLVDGAHAPGMVELALDPLGAAYYAGNLHKWVCAPKGAGFLWVRRDRQHAVRPLTISHGADLPRADRSRFRLEFDWQGTGDPTPWLAVPAAIDFGASLMAGGWPAVRARNRAIALAARDRLCAATRQSAAAPDDMIGSMASVPLAWEAEPASARDGSLYGDRLHDALLEAGFQVTVTPWPQRPHGKRWRRLVRISVAAYNDLDQYTRLAAAMADFLTPAG
ncbi:MAG TPA: aminotransferase class V-fold PLP-dependent enzyme [Candidatus Limnocylindria bacterium]|nr:aminotransferase class V-fold PLP-dependent enzyme [Candidatus Limnocylindria bacterium]